MATRHKNDQSGAAEARERVDEFRQLIRDNRIAGDNAVDNAQVREAARTLLREARTNPEVAREVNALQDRDARAALISAREDKQARSPAMTRQSAYVATAARVVNDIEDPARRERATEVLRQMSAELEASRRRDQVRDRDQEIEASA